MRKKTRWSLIGIAGIMLVGFLLRLVNIGKEPLWGDEILSLDIFTHFSSYRETVRYVREVEFHPPLFYVVMKAWTAVFGTSNLAIRLPSALCGMATIGVVFAAARKMFRSPRAAFAAAGLMAVLPIQLEYGQEARPYAMVTLAGAVAFYALWSYATTDRRSALVLYVVACTAGLYLHYSFMFPLVGFAAWSFIDAFREKERRDRRLIELLVAHAAVSVAFVWWLPAFLSKILLGKFTVFGQSRGHIRVLRIGSFESLLPQLVWMKYDAYASKIETLAQIGASLLAMVLTVRTLQGTARRGSETSAITRRALLMCGAVFVVTAVLFLMSPMAELQGKMFVRYVITASIPIVLAVGALTAAVPRKVGMAFFSVLVITLIPTGALVLGDDYLWNPSFRVEEVAGYLNDHVGPDEIVLINLVAWRSNIDHYLRPDLDAIPFIPIANYGMNDSWTSRATLGIMENEAQVRADKVTPDDITGKLDRLMDMYHPAGVWLYWFDGDRDMTDWFKAHGWRRAFRAIGNMFPIDHYVKE